MSAVNRTCEEIIEKVTCSNLDYKIKVTPYSIFFSIRKKFAKITSEQNVSPQEALVDELLVPRLQQELLLVRGEYQKLYDFYQDELRKTEIFEVQLQNIHNHVHEKEILEKENEAKHKKEVIEKKQLQTSLEHRSIEIKNFKFEIEELKKDKNILSVALKTSKQEIKEQNKSFEKKVSVFEKKIEELSEYKVKKLSEEREEKLRQKREKKKAKQKLNQGENKDMPEGNTASPALKPEKPEIAENFSKVDVANNIEPEGKMLPEHKNKDENESIKELEVGNLDDDEKLAEATHVVERTEFDEGYTYEEGFIGPRLPRRLTQAEIDKFYEEMLGKLRFPS